MLVDDVSDNIQELRGEYAELQRRVDGDGALATTAEEDDAMYLDAMDQASSHSINFSSSKSVDPIILANS